MWEMLSDQKSGHGKARSCRRRRQWKNFPWSCEKNWIKRVNLLEDVHPNIIVWIILEKKYKYIKVLILGGAQPYEKEWFSIEHEVTTGKGIKNGKPKAGLSYLGYEVRNGSLLRRHFFKPSDIFEVSVRQLSNYWN